MVKKKFKIRREGYRSAKNNASPGSVKIIIPIILLATISTFLLSCKKVITKKEKCKITTINFPTGNVAYHIAYNNEGNISSLSVGNASITYTYSNDKTTITTTDAGRFISKVVASKNTNGLAVNVRTEYNADGSNWDNSAYEYNRTELVKRTFTSSTNDNQITVYTWLDKNVKSSVLQSSAINYEFYKDRLNQPGDYFWLAQLVQGYETLRNKNVPKSIGDDHFTYQFGVNGISSLTARNGTNMNIVDYGYTCE